MYENSERYFGACRNCGECCTLPGMFLPEQIDLLAVQLNLGPEHLFRKYLVAELFTPRIDLPPLFILSPAKATGWGSREMRFLLSGEKTDRSRYCVFREQASRICTIHRHKPFGCTVLICDKMTQAGPITLNKTYYYHKWLDGQQRLFKIFPDLGSLYGKLIRTVSPLPFPRQERKSALALANSIIGREMAELMNGEENDRKFYCTEGR